MDYRSLDKDGAWNETYEEWMGRIWRRAFKGFGLFLIVTLGVACGNLISTYIAVHAASVAADREIKAFKENIEGKAERAAEEIVNKAEELRPRLEEHPVHANRRQKELEKQQAIQKKRRSTCLYWIDQYRKTGKTMDKMHRDNSCRDAGIKIGS